MDKSADKGGNPLTETWFIDCYASPSRANVAKDVCPCLTKSRTEHGGYYVVNRGAMLTSAQMLKPQGIDPKRILMPKGVSKRQLTSAIGNAVAVPVLARITLNLRKALNYVSQFARAD